MRTLLLSLLVSGSLLAGCTSTLVDEAAAPVPELTFAQLKTLPVNVSRIDFNTQTQRGSSMWDVASELPTPPDTAMSRYLNKRFRAIGTDGVLGINLQKAQIHSEQVPNENKILSYVPLADIYEYTFDVVVDIESAYLAGHPDTKSTKRFVRKTRMPMNVTMAYREAKLQRALEEIMSDIDDALVRTMSHDFNLIAERDIPKSALAAKTELPETKTGVGVYWREFKEEVGETVDKVEKTFEEGAPTSITPRAVESEPLNN